ncbi:uncharacterized protein LOC118188070 [Stegodyphus dumicola]|uniref:uncharacterized protein LOC118188070 n=1 Tax=Stegodyphus dumicola TaxID=202533 RepID=UPI0015A81FCA|nr:uncharacterized protein LOC118188070 [Stegodyphus dumicola]
MATKRFVILEKQFKGDELLFERYNGVMKEQLSEVITEICNNSCFVGYVMPHSEVIREDSLSAKTRVVSDASSKQGSCNSLNEYLLPGENSSVNLVDIILKFTEHKIGLCGDIARTLQIQVTRDDRNYLCFVYYENCNKTQATTTVLIEPHLFSLHFGCNS